ncbi:hypothetical protein ACVIGB_000827 [Bradyrhizobium sp. USDA 4341]
MRNRRPSDDMRVVEDELRVAKFLRREIDDASRLFEQLKAQLEGIENILIDEAKSSAAENFDEEDVDDVVRIAGRRLSGEPADDKERHSFLDRIDALAGGDAFARIQALLGRAHLRQETSRAATEKAETAAPVAGKEQSRPPTEAKKEEALAASLEAVEVVEPTAPEADQGQEAEVRPEPPSARQQPEQSPTPADQGQAGEPPKARKQTAVNGVEVPRRREVEVSGVAVPLSRQEKALAIQTAAYVDAETTGRMNPPNGQKTSWQVRIYENAFRTRLREKHAVEATTDAAPAGAQSVEATLAGSPSEPETIAELDAELAAPAAPEVTEPAEAGVVPETTLEAPPQQSDEADEVDATFDDDDEPPLETDEDRYPPDTPHDAYDVNDNTIGFDDDEDDRIGDENFPEPDDEPPMRPQERVATPSYPPAQQPVATEPVSPPAQPRAEPTPATHARANPPAVQPRPPAQPPRAPAVRVPTSPPVQPRPPQQPSVRAPVTRPPAPRTDASAAAAVAPTAPGPQQVAPAASPVTPSTPQPAAAEKPQGLMPRGNLGFMPTVNPNRRSIFDKQSPLDRESLPPMVRETAVTTVAAEPEPERRRIRRPSIFERIKQEDPPD